MLEISASHLGHLTISLGIVNVDDWGYWYWLKVRGKMLVGSVMVMDAETSLAAETARLIYIDRE